MIINKKGMGMTVMVFLMAITPLLFCGISTARKNQTDRTVDTQAQPAPEGVDLSVAPHLR